MEKKDLKDIERELKEIKTFTIAQARLQKEILMEIKQLWREINGYFRREQSGKHPNRKSD